MTISKNPQQRLFPEEPNWMFEVLEVFVTGEGIVFNFTMGRFATLEQANEFIDNLEDKDIRIQIRARFL